MKNQPSALTAVQEWTVIQMAEYIEREALLQQLEMAIECKDCPRNADRKTYYDRCACSEIQDICDAITEAPKADVQPANQWISVDDKLPEWDKAVLVWYASDTLFGVSEGYGLSWYHGSWHLNELNGEIFYWQYLPEKPKED